MQRFRISCLGLETGEQDLGGVSGLDERHLNGVEDKEVAARGCEDGGSAAGTHRHGAELLRGLGEALVPAQGACPIVFDLDCWDEVLRRVALGMSFTGLVGDTEGGVALRGVVDLAAHVAALV